MPKTLKQYEDAINTNGFSDYQIERTYRQLWEEYKEKDFAAEFASLSTIGDLERYRTQLEDFLHSNKKANYRGMISAEDEIDRKLVLYKKTFLDLENINSSTESERKALQSYINFLWQSCGFQHPLNVNVQQAQDSQFSLYLNDDWYDVDRNLVHVSIENNCVNVKRLLNKISEARAGQALTSILSDLLHSLIVKDYIKLEQLLKDPANYHYLYQETMVWQVAALTGTAEELLKRIDIRVVQDNSRGTTKVTFPHCDRTIEYHERESPDVLRVRAVREILGTQFKNALFIAAANNNVFAIRWILQQSDARIVAVIDSNGMTVLHWAAAFGNIDTINCLLASGARIHNHDGRGMGVLDHAVVNGHLVAVNILIPALKKQVNNADDLKLLLSRALLFAVKQGNGPVASLLIREGATLEYREQIEQPVRGSLSALDWIFANDNLAMLRCIWEKVRDDAASFVHLAALYGSTTLMQFLEQNACNIQQTYGLSASSPLHTAAEQGNVDLVRFLVERGVATDTYDGRQTTPLSLAAAKGHAEVAEYLLSLKDDKKVSIKKVIGGDQTSLAQVALFDDDQQVKARYKIFKAILDTEDELIMGDDFIQNFELQPANEQQKRNLKALQQHLLNSAQVCLKAVKHTEFEAYANNMMVVIADLKNAEMPIKVSIGVYLLAKEMAKEYLDDALKVKHIIRCETLLQYYMKLIAPSRSEKFYMGLLTFAGLALSMILGAAAIIGVGVLIGTWASPLMAVGGVAALVTGGVTEVSAMAAGVLAGGTVLAGGIGAWLMHRSCFWKPKFQLAEVAREQLIKKEAFWELPLSMELARKNAPHATR